MKNRAYAILLDLATPCDSNMSPSEFCTTISHKAIGLTTRFSSLAKMNEVTA